MTGTHGDTAAYTERFADIAARLPGAELPWLDKLRHDAIARFATDGVPTARVEEWRYSDLAALRGTAFDHAGAGDHDIAAAMSTLPFDLSGVRRAIFVNGHFQPTLSDIGGDGIRVQSLAAAFAESPDLVEGCLGRMDHLVEKRLSGRDDTRPHSLVAMNTAFAGGGAVIHAAAGSLADGPIHVVHVAGPGEAPAVSHVRNLVVADPGSHVTVVESYLGSGAGTHWTNAVTDVSMAADATVEHYRLQIEAPETVHIGTTHATLAKGARFNSFVMSLGGTAARNEIRVDIAGDHGECRLNGVYLARGKQRMDTLTRVDHRGTSGVTHELYKGAVDDQAQAAFQGKIHVAPDAVQTSAHQTNRNVLLSDRARADSKPELEILTDDVKCSHGATVGDLDTQALFYLRARGVDEEAARRILIRAFVEEPLEAVAAEDLREGFSAALDGWLATGGAAS